MTSNPPAYPPSKDPTDPTHAFASTRVEGIGVGGSPKTTRAAKPALPKYYQANPTTAEKSDTRSRAGISGLIVTDLLKLRIALDQTVSLENACQVLAEQLCNLFECSNVFVSIDNNNRLSLNGQEQDGSLELDEEALLSAQQEPTFEQTMVGWPASDYWPTSLVHKNLVNENHSVAISFLLQDSNKERIGVITFIDEKSKCSAISRKIKPVLDLVAPHLKLLGEVSKSVFQKISNAIKAKLFSSTKWFVIGCLLFAFCFVPIPHRIQCDSEAKPVVRRYVSSPFEGVLKSGVVRVGDSIKQGDTLAWLDEDEIRLQMSSTNAEMEKYRKLKSAALAKGDTLAMQQAQLEYRRLVYKNDLLQQRIRNLKITSPINGVVLSNELEDAEGAPLSQGQVLFEIAPLDRMVFSIYILQQDIALVKEGMRVQITMDAANQKFEGTIRQIRPQAETFENESVFVAEVEFDNTNGAVRPGMRGYASVIGPNQSIGWILFRKPYGFLKKLAGF